MGKNIIITSLIFVIFFLLLRVHWIYNDWNWVASLAGSVITGLITWFAVDKTSKLDKRSRKFEKKYTYYQEELFNLNSNLKLLKALNWSFYDDPSNLSHTLHKFEKDKYFDIQKTEKIKNILLALGVYEQKWRNENYINFVENLINTQKHYNYLLSDFLATNKNSDIFSFSHNNISYNVQLLMNKVQSENKNINYNYQSNLNLIEEIQDMINNEFNLDKE